MQPAPAMPKSWRVDNKPHKFCPGCGHGLILKCLGQAIDELEIQSRVVYGCDIGCSLLSWDLFNLDTVQTHHGRTTPVMTGMKRARPELLCIAYMGDGGGYSIGVQHLVGAAMRNEKITVIVANNTQYAMTGGQMAPTTLPGQKTETCPYGRDPGATGLPFQGAEMISAIAPDGAYVARGSISHLTQLTGFLKKALKNQIDGHGFSLVEALSACPTNWRTDAARTWEFIEKDMAGYFKRGEIKIPGQKEAAANA